MHRTQDAVDAAEDLPSLEPSRPPPSAPSVSMWRLLVPRFAASFLGVAAFLTGEAVVVGVLQHAQLIGPWELLVALTYLVPVGSLAALPLTLLGAITVPLLVAGSSRAARGALAVLAGLGAVSVAYGVSTGPHLANPALRAGFVAAVGCAAVAAAWFLSPAVQNLRARRPGAFLVSCVALLVGCSVANAAVLPKLYPAFHLALSALAVLASAWGGVSVSQYLSPRTWVRAAAVVMLLAAVAMPFVIHALQGWDNVRRVYLTHAPSLGRAVQVAAWLAPERAREAVPSRLDPAAAESEQQWLDWKGRDVLIVSVDALRADHVSAYGYARRTTPEMDAIASQGVLFEYAYCAMPHTSYSMTSLLTGKYMRPLLLQGAGQDSDTLAAVLRRYDYRTAAFFPHSLVVVDQERFGWVHERGLDFDYRKVEYAKGPKRLAQFVEYLDQAPTDHPVFAWVHLFEPHEPYESHPEHPFGDRAVDRYDSEIASADAVLGQVVRVMRERRPNTVVILTADHGEAFGEHGAHYHGTTVFDEQTRVPLIISTNGLDARRVSVPVQLIDIFPTLLHAMDIPRRPRVRGNDLGPWLVGKAKGDGFAFSETHEQTLLAQGRWRLVCERNVDACALFDLQADPQQKRDVTVQQPERYAQMRAALREVESSHGAFERAGARQEGKSLPAALVRGMAGDADAAPDVAALLEDADVVLRRRAAQVLHDLKSKDTAPPLSLAVSRDEDEAVRRWCALALTRMGHGAPLVHELLGLNDLAWKRRAALALAEGGDASGETVLLAWWNEGNLAEEQAKLIARALGNIRSPGAVVPLTRSLSNAKLRPVIAEVLARIGDPYGRVKLLEHLPEERYVHTRAALVRALIRMGATRELAPALARFLGVPDPLAEGVQMAAQAGVLDALGGPDARGLARLRAAGAAGVALPIVIPKGGNGSGARVVVRARLRDGAQDDSAAAQIRIGLPHRRPAALAGAAPGPAARLDTSTAVVLHVESGAWSEPFANLPAAPRAGRPAELLVIPGRDVILDALVVVPLADEVSPPPPAPWSANKSPDAGPSPDVQPGSPSASD